MAEERKGEGMTKGVLLGPPVTQLWVILAHDVLLNQSTIRQQRVCNGFDTHLLKLQGREQISLSHELLTIIEIPKKLQLLRF